MKALTSEGRIEQCASVNYGLTPEFKRRRTLSCNEAMEKRKHHERRHSMPDSFFYTLHPQHLHEKETPVKKTEHTKLKIIPKKIYEGLQ